MGRASARAEPKPRRLLPVPVQSLPRTPPSSSSSSSPPVPIISRLATLLRASRTQSLANPNGRSRAYSRPIGMDNPLPITGSGRDGGAFAFISKGWREVRDSATADLQLMRTRTDRELGRLLSSASALAGPGPSPPFAELEFVRKRIQPKIAELRKQYSSTVLDGPGASLRVDLSAITAIRNAIVSNGNDGKRWRVAWWNEDGRDRWREGVGGGDHDTERAQGVRAPEPID